MRRIRDCESRKEVTVAAGFTIRVWEGALDDARSGLKCVDGCHVVGPGFGKRAVT
jgi:hypothetical protein